MLIREFFDLVASPWCAGCGVSGVRWCAVCSTMLSPLLGPRLTHRRNLVGASSFDVQSPLLFDQANIQVFFADFYRGPLREAINAWKDHGRADVTSILSEFLSGPLFRCRQAQSCWTARILIVPVPSTNTARRRRGWDPVWTLARRSARHDAYLDAVRVLRHTRPVADQAGLDAASRQKNLYAAMTVSSSWRARLTGRQVIVVDDVITTGATIHAAQQALTAVGAILLGAVTVASTPLNADMCGSSEKS
ncbi:MAG: ComF family protein [Actinomycetota bacterium]